MATRQKQELKEQARFIQWAKEQGLEPYAVPLSTYTASWSAINDNKMAGVRRGIPDIILFIPAKRSIISRVHIVFIEMKKEKGGYATPEQKEFLELVSQVEGSVHGAVCHGFNEAVAFTRPLINEKEISEAEQSQWLKDNNLI